jgi:cyclopropane fatty-acyl-phospholipid synthase-like methyltransferase
MKPRSEASERNRAPILAVLRQWMIAPGTVLEIGSGTGQHAVHFAAAMPHLRWVASDLEQNHAGITAWIEESALTNLSGPITLDVRDPDWPFSSLHYVYSANTAHIMSWESVATMFGAVGRVLRRRGLFFLYGPVNRGGQFTSESNREFDRSLRARDPAMGLRDDQALIALASRCQLTYAADYSMPARNRMLIWQKE